MLLPSLILILSLLADLFLAGYTHSWWVSLVLANFILQVTRPVEKCSWLQIGLTGGVLVIENFIRYAQFELTVALVCILTVIGQSLALELNSRRLASYLLIILWLGLYSSGLILQAVWGGVPSTVALGNLALELILELLLVTGLSYLTDLLY